MALFNFLKKKPETSFIDITGKSGVDLLGHGVLFDRDVFLNWGSDIEGDKRYIRKEYRADRTIYHWGERSVFNRLTLYFKTICWTHKQKGDTKSFESIDFLSEDSDAETVFYKIKVHLTEIFGEPKQEQDVKEGDIGLEWKVNAVKISLSLFNKERRKVHLEIGWWF